jgi:iron complex outermembrane recepter protein
LSRARFFRNFAPAKTLEIKNMKIQLLLLSVLALPYSVNADNIVVGNPDATRADSSVVHDIEEVVVTSQPKESFRLRRQPLSASSLSASDINRTGVRDLRDVSAYVPSFVMPSYGARYTSSIYLRGFGSRINNPAVGIYVDDIPVISKSAYNSHFYDVSRIDVLRGPQGTLYGQNTEGGIVRIYTRDPMQYSGTEVRLGLGSYLWRNVEVGHYGKINNRLAFSVAGFYDGQNGFLHNAALDSHADLLNEAGGRLRFVYAPNSRLTLNLTADYQHVAQNAFAYGILNSGETVPAAPSSNYQNHYRRDMTTTGVGLKYVGEKFLLNSTTSYQYLRDEILMDQDYTDADYMHLTQSQINNALTEEFTIKNKKEGLWNWLFGAVASCQWLHTDAPVYFGDAMTSSIAQGIQTTIYNGILKGMTAKGMSESVAAAVIDRAGGVNVGLSMQVPGSFSTPQLNVGVFHESNINITPRLTATLGLRYDYNNVKVNYDTEAEMLMTAAVMGQSRTAKIASCLNSKASEEFSQLLPKVALTYKVADNDYLYALLSKGYRAGGYNIQMFSDILQTELTANARSAMGGNGDVAVEHSAADYENVKATISYKPEVSWNYEVGCHLNLFANSLHLDMSAFYMRISNQQLSVMAGQYGFGRMMVNAGKSRTLGAELSLRGAALDNRLDWQVSYALTNTVFREYTDSVKVNGKLELKDYRNKRVPYVPLQTLGAAANYRISVKNSCLHSLVIGASTTAMGNIYWDEDNSYSQNFYALLNAHIDADFGLLKVSLWGKNLTSTRYNTFALESSATGNTLHFAQRGTPCQVGVDVKLAF